MTALQELGGISEEFLKVSCYFARVWFWQARAPWCSSGGTGQLILAMTPETASMLAMLICFLAVHHTEGALHFR